MGRFASNTNVPTEKSRAEIESTLRRYGADGFRYGWADRDGKRIEQIEFSAQERVIRFTLPMPSKDDPEFSRTPARRQIRSQQARLAAWEQACRQRWRALNLAIKAKLECVECGISEFESEFLSHIVDPQTGRTVGETIRPQLEDRYTGIGGRIELPGLPEPEDVASGT